MELNPYATPNSEAHAQPGSGRPGWVWVIFIFIVLSILSKLVSYVLIMYKLSGMPEQQEYLSLTAKGYALAFLFASISLVAAIQLFRLRRNSFHFFMADLLIGVALLLWRIVQSGGAHLIAGVAGVVVIYGLKIAICAYVWRLSNSGVLK